MAVNSTLPDTAETGSAPAALTETPVKRTRGRASDDGAGTPFTCPSCDTTHVRSHRGQKFCSQECYRVYWNREVKVRAARAGGQANVRHIEAQPHRRTEAGRFAGRPKEPELASEKPRDQAAAPRTAATPEASQRTRRKFVDDAPGTGAACPTCRSVYVRTSRGQKYCSVECYRAAQKRRGAPSSTTGRGAEAEKAPEPSDGPAADTVPESGGTRAPFPDDMPLAERERRLRSRMLDAEGRSGADWAAAGNLWQSQLRESRVITCSGWGCSLRVERDHLVIRSGLTQSEERGGKAEEIRLSRGLHRLEAVVLPGHSAGLSTDALEWCLDQKVAVYIITRDGELAAILEAPAERKVQLRRLQYAADPLALARDTFMRKVAAQEWAKPELREFCEAAREEARRAQSVDELRLIEGRLASVYWMCWRNLQLTWKGPGVPDEWRRFESRTSQNGGNRHARHPANAMLNYAHAVLAARMLRAIVARGLDPDVGSLHKERDGRHSLVYDLLEPLYARQEPRLLSWISAQTFRVASFPVDRAGVCRLHDALRKVVIQESQIPDSLIEAEVEHYLSMIRRTPSESSAVETEPQHEPERITG